MRAVAEPLPWHHKRRDVELRLRALVFECERCSWLTSDGSRVHACCSSALRRGECCAVYKGKFPQALEELIILYAGLLPSD